MCHKVLSFSVFASECVRESLSHCCWSQYPSLNLTAHCSAPTQLFSVSGRVASITVLCPLLYNQPNQPIICTKYGFLLVMYLLETRVYCW